MRGDRKKQSKHGTVGVFQFTPLREGRLTARMGRKRWQIFQFTPLREGRQFTYDALNAFSVFQFTPLREGRHQVLEQGHQGTYFNSRPCVRGDVLQQWGQYKGHDISIHAPA